MGEFLLELLFLFAEIIFEALFEFALEAAFDLIVRAMAEVSEISEFKNPLLACVGYVLLGAATGGDRKSTRLNSSHGYISYAVFCLKKQSHEFDASAVRSDCPCAVLAIMPTSRLTSTKFAAPTW